MAERLIRLFWPAPRKKERLPEEIARNRARFQAAGELAGEIRKTDFPYPITRIVLFGGVARNKDRADSDIDLAIVFGNLGYRIPIEIEKKLDFLAREMAQEKFGEFRTLPFHLTVLTETMYQMYKETSAVIKAIHQDGIEL